MINEFIMEQQEIERPLTKSQRKKIRQKKRDKKWLEDNPSTSGNPKDQRKLDKKPRQMAQKSSRSFGRYLGKHGDRIRLVLEGKKDEAETKRAEAEAEKTKAIRQAEYAQELATTNRIDRGQKPPEQKDGLQLIYDKGFRVISWAWDQVALDQSLNYIHL